MRTACQNQAFSVLKESCVKFSNNYVYKRVSGVILAALLKRYTLVLPVRDVIIPVWRHEHVIQVSAERAHFDVITRVRYVTCGHVASDARDFAIIALISTTSVTELSTCRQLYWTQAGGALAKHRVVPTTGFGGAQIPATRHILHTLQ